MKKLISFVLVLMMSILGVSIGPSANAGQIDAVGAQITWDDSSLYAPISCSTYTIKVAANSTIWNVDLHIKNKFGDIVGGYSSVYGSGQTNLQICNGKDLTGTVLVAVVTTHTLIKSVYEKPITFLSRNGATASPTPAATGAALPTPAPTVTVTATPAPAPTIFLTNPEDRTLRDLVNSLQSEVKLLKAKLKKICAAKPKPRGC